jgi:purine-binding chemotaxis protein CheW
MRRLRDSPEMASHVTATEGDDQIETAQFVVFRLGTELFGLPISAVDEIVRVPDRISRLPNAPEFLEGVVNLRGDVLPIIDQRKRFGLPVDGSLIRKRLVVVRSDRHRAGLIVDAVSEVLQSSPSAIEPAPRLIAGTSGLVSGVINLPDRGQMILLLEAEELLSEAEHELLEGLAITNQAGP